MTHSLLSWTLTAALTMTGAAPAIALSPQADGDPAISLLELLRIIETDDVERALERYRNAGPGDPGDGSLLIRLATVLEELDRPDDAGAVIHAGLIQLHPDDPAAHLVHGDLHWRSGEPGPAAEAYRAALEIAPDSARAAERVAEVDAIVGLDLDPVLRDALETGGVEYALAVYERHWDSYRYSRLIDFRPHVLSELGLDLALEGNVDDAIPFLHENNQRHQRDPGAELAHAEVHSLQGTMAREVRQAFESALRAMEQRQEAEERLAARLRELHRDWQPMPDALEGELMHAEVHRRRGETDLARQVYEGILEVDPDHAEARAGLREIAA